MNDDDIIRRHVMVDGSRIFYLSLDREPHATRPVIVLIHGSGVNAGCWIEQLRGLHATRVVAIDLPGHGESDDIGTAGIEHLADVAAALIAALGAAPVIAVGHSLGGAVALALAARHSEAVDGLVLLSTCARLPSTSVPAHWLLPLLPGPLRKAMFFTTAQALLFAASASRRTIAIGMHELRACRPATLARDVALSRSMDFTEVATALRVPTLVVCGSRDQITPSILAAALQTLIPGSRLSIVEGAGHKVLLEAPDVVNREIHAFADAVAAGKTQAAASPRQWCRRFRQWAATLPAALCSVAQLAGYRPTVTRAPGARG